MSLITCVAAGVILPFFSCVFLMKKELFLSAITAASGVYFAVAAVGVAGQM